MFHLLVGRAALAGEARSLIVTAELRSAIAAA